MRIKVKLKPKVYYIRKHTVVMGEWELITEKDLMRKCSNSPGFIARALHNVKIGNMEMLMLDNECYQVASNKFP
jgi:hypothetical protein